MEWFTADMWMALLSIVLIDLVLAGDNAIVIGMAAKNVPKPMQRTVIVWGTFGAIAIRALATVAVVWLLKVPGLLLAGGLLLIWISYKLLVEKKGHHDIAARSSVWAAIRTIIVADAVMGMDNVIAIAGASHGSFWLVVIGLLISVPIVVWGSSLFIRLVERYAIVVYAGAGVLAFTAGKMLTGEPLLEDWFAANPIWKWSLIVVIVVGVLAAGWMKERSQRRATASRAAAENQEYPKAASE
jgi:YjbE family integral membrane protein